MNVIPKIDVFYLTRSKLKTLKITGSPGGQANTLVDKANDIARAGQGTAESVGHSLTVTSGIAKKLNIL
ncbi:MAG: hypothetical protein ACJAT2_003680 [Bacteriovoracaceae bacterium]|jgi:hypothetical protein